MPHRFPRGLSHSNARIVVAEDDDEMRRVLIDGLREDGYEVTALSSGLALLDALMEMFEAGQQPALIVSDVRMPGLTGLEVLASIRAWGWQLPVLLITGFGDDELMDRAGAVGATVVFSKPFDIDDLRTAVTCFLGGP